MPHEYERQLAARRRRERLADGLELVKSEADAQAEASPKRRRRVETRAGMLERDWSEQEIG